MSLVQLSDLELREELAAACADEGSAQLRKLRALRKCEKAAIWSDDDCRDMIQWVAINLGCSFYRAERLLDAARALERLPRLSDSLAMGLLPLEKVLQLARVAQPEDEERWIKWAAKASVNAIKSRADALLVEPLEKAGERDLLREVQTWFDDCGRFGLLASLPAEQGVLVMKAIDRLAQTLPVSPVDGKSMDEIRVEVRRADALVAMASAAIAEDQSSDRPTVLVHADIRSLVSGDGNCTLENGTPVHPEVARRLVCDSKLQVVLHGDGGKVVGIGRANRTPPRWLRRLVDHRDGGRCTFPGCGSRRFVQAHHINWWHEQGPTDLDNLVLACTFHHKLVHEHRWSVSLGADGTTDWRTPDGRPFVPGPAPP